MTDKKLKDPPTEAVAGEKVSVTNIETRLKNVFSVFDYMKDATAGILECKSLHAITQEITNVDEHMLELKGINPISDEFMPAYKEVVVEKGHLFVQEIGVQAKKTLTDKLPMPRPFHIDHTCSCYDNKVKELKWHDPSGFQIFPIHHRVGNGEFFPPHIILQSGDRNSVIILLREPLILVVSTHHFTSQSAVLVLTNAFRQ